MDFWSLVAQKGKAADVDIMPFDLDYTFTGVGDPSGSSSVMQCIHPQ